MKLFKYIYKQILNRKNASCWTIYNSLPADRIEQDSLSVQVAENKQITSSAIDSALELEQERKVQRSTA